MVSKKQGKDQSLWSYSWPQKITGFPFWEDVAERQNAT